MTESRKLLGELKELETQRKNGEIDIKAFYDGLLNLLSSLREVLVKEDINEKEIKKQIPLLLVFLKNQISDLSLRGK